MKIHPQKTLKHYVLKLSPNSLYTTVPTYIMLDYPINYPNVIKIYIIHTLYTMVSVDKLQI